MAWWVMVFVQGKKWPWIMDIISVKVHKMPLKQQWIMVWTPCKYTVCKFDLEHAMVKGHGTIFGPMVNGAHLCELSFMKTPKRQQWVQPRHYFQTYHLSDLGLGDLRMDWSHNTLLANLWIRLSFIKFL